MVDKRSRKCGQKNKGTNVNLEENEDSNTSEIDTSNTPCCKSLNKVQEDVKTVIELMGPTTPHLVNSSSNLADNEESYFSNSTNFQQDKSKPENNEATENEYTEGTLAPDITFQEDSDYSVIAARNSVIQQTTNETMPGAQLICPPPWLSSNIMFNPECVCPQIASYVQNNMTQGNLQREVEQPTKCLKENNLLSSIFKTFGIKRNGTNLPKKYEYYTMNVKHSRSTQGIPKRLVFDLVNDVPVVCEECHGQPSADVLKISTNRIFEKRNSKKMKAFSDEQIPEENIHSVFPQAKKFVSKELRNKFSKPDACKITRVDVYYFDHGNPDYLRTTDRPPKTTTEVVAEKTEAYTTKFWAELFGTCHIGLSFLTSFILQFIRFLLYTLLRPLTIGLIQLVSDYFFKPCLTTTFNGLIQPPLTFLYNVATSVKELCEPIAKGIGYFIREVSVIIRSFRVVEVTHRKCSHERQFVMDGRNDIKCGIV